MPKNINKDYMGVAISGLCVVHCLATPVLPALLPALFSSLPPLLFSVDHGHSSVTFLTIEISFWVLALLINILSLRSLLKPHECIHHPHSPQETSRPIAVPVAVPHFKTTNKKISLIVLKKISITLSAVAWIWVILVMLCGLPHLLLIFSSLFLIGSHLVALTRSLRLRQEG